MDGSLFLFYRIERFNYLMFPLHLKQLKGSEVAVHSGFQSMSLVYSWTSKLILYFSTEHLVVITVH